MRTVDLRATSGAWTTSAFPARNAHGAPTLYVSSGGTIRRAWLWFARPVPLGATVQSATLTLTFGTGWNGKSFDLSVKRILGGWKSSKITHGNAPDVDTVDAGESLSGITFHDTAEFDVTDLVQAIADGAPWYGLRIGVESGASGSDQTIFGPRALDQSRRPELVVEYVIPPSTPTGLRPSSGHAVGVASPRLSWVFASSDPSAVQGRSWVQVSTDPTFAATDWDAGWLVNAVPEQLVGITLASSTVYYWRVKVEDSAGQQSEWSDVVSFVYAAKPVVAITYPAADNDVIPDSTPTISHTVTGGAQTRAQRLVTSPVGAVLFDTGELATDELEIMLPAGVITEAGVEYLLVVRVWDDVEREATPGEPTYAEARRTFLYSPTADILPVAALTATARDDPGVDLVWRYTGAVEAFALIVDGRIVADLIQPDAALHGPPNDYSLTYWRAAPGVEHVFEIRAVVDDGGILKHSSGNPTASLGVSVGLMWIFRPSTGEAVPLYGGAEPALTVGEDSTVYAPPGRTDPFVVTSSIRGYESTLDGVILDHAGTPAAQFAALLESWIALANTDEIRIAYGPHNFPIVTPAGKVVAPRRASGYTVALPFAQAGESFAVPVDEDPFGWGESGWGN